MRIAIRKLPGNPVNYEIIKDLAARLEFEPRTIHRVQYFKNNHYYRIYFKSGEKSEKFFLGKEPK